MFILIRSFSTRLTWAFQQHKNAWKLSEINALQPRIMTISSTLLISLIFQGYHCESNIAILAWRVTWIYAYSLFKYLLMQDGTSVTFHSPLLRHLDTTLLRPSRLYPQPDIVHSYTIIVLYGRGLPTTSVQFMVDWTLFWIMKGAVQLIAKTVKKLSFWQSGKELSLCHQL